MRRSTTGCLALLLGAAVLSSAALAQDVRDPFVVEVSKPMNAVPFSTSRVRLLDGPFKAAQDRHAKYLLDLSADRLLAWFRKEAGLEPRAPVYGGWESRSIAGHSLGHYLSGLSKMYAATGDERFKERVAYTVSELAECQRKHGDGYVAAIPEGRRIFREVAAGDIRSRGFDLNGGWVPWYTLHKQFAGLRDAYVYCNNEQARQVLVGLADWADELTGKLTPAQMQTMLACEHGGMNEVAADVYALTGDRKYLELARRFNHDAVLDPLAAKQDRLAGLHANTQIPKLVGVARQQELLVDEKLLEDAPAFFWTVVTRDHSYVIGGNSHNEHFGPPRVLSTRLRGNTAETCNTYNMLRLTRTLHAWSGYASLMTYYERAMFNHILASQNPDTAGVVYYLPLGTGSHKPFQSLDDAFTCCVGTGMENHASYGDMIYSHAGQTLLVNQFLASELDWSEVGVRVRQQTRFPDEPGTTLRITTAAPKELTLKIRRPSWVGDGFAITVNDQPLRLEPSQGDEYVAVRRTWNDGDTVRVALPMSLRVEPTHDNPNVVALLYGPIVLVANYGPTTPRPDEVATIVSESNDPSAWLSKVSDAPLRFATTDAVRPKQVELVPFFRIRDERYQVYFDRFDRAGWERHQAELLAERERQRALEARTTDFFQPGEMQPERDHDLQGERMATGSHMGRKWRTGENGGWFSFTMKLPEEGRAQLVLTYWGSDSGRRTFDVYVDDQKIATQSLNNPKPNAWHDVVHELPEELTRGKQSVRVKLQAHPGNIAGGLFGARMVRPERAP
jgi:DUF1680 family protein